MGLYAWSAMKRLRWLVAASLAALALAACARAGEDDVPTSVESDPPEPSTEAPSTPACTDPPCYAEPQRTGVLDAAVVEQPSGLAASLRTPGTFYAVSDVAGTAAVVAIREDGSRVETITIDGMSAENAEALAVGPCGPSSQDTCLFVGDLGDHIGRPDVVIYRVPEPDLDDLPAAVPADALRYTYPDGPTDAEALIVDSEGRPVIISKAAARDAAIGTEATVVYRGGTDGGRVERIGELALPEPENPVFALIVGNVVTGADTLRDGRVLIRTYDEIIEYRAGDASADVATFPDWDVRRVPTPSQVQSEAIAYRADGCGYLSVAERSGDIQATTC